LRAQIREKRRDVLPRLRAAVASARRQRAERLRACKRYARDRQREVKRAGLKLEAELRKRVAAAKLRAQQVAKHCNARAATSGTEQLEQALAALEAERAQIAALRARAGALRSTRGRKGGARAAELRAESDDAVRAELGNERVLLALWDRLRGKIRATEHMSRAEAFFEHLHNHPELLDEERARKERAWEREAGELLESASEAPGGTAAQPDELRDCLAMLNRCELHCERGTAVPF